MISCAGNTSPVIYCHRGSINNAHEREAETPKALRRPPRTTLGWVYWDVFWQVYAGNALQPVPLSFGPPRSLKPSWASVFGVKKRFVVLLGDEIGEPQATEVLCHEWAHVLAWNFSIERIANSPDTDPVIFEHACHDETWGCTYSRVWRAYLDVAREPALGRWRPDRRQGP